jgi:hypothetical protein
MVLIAAAALAASVPPERPTQSAGASVQARATIRVIAGVQLHLGEEKQSRDGFVARDSVIRSAGTEQPAKLMEFQ